MTEESRVDWQAAFNIAVGAFGALFGWWLNVVWGAHKEVRDEIASFKQHVSETYCRRDDFKDNMAAMFAKLDRIEAKLDRKVDRE